MKLVGGGSVINGTSLLKRPEDDWFWILGRGLDGQMAELLTAAASNPLHHSPVQYGTKSEKSEGFV